jgi:hypothetical protein
MSRPPNALLNGTTYLGDIATADISIGFRV